MTRKTILLILIPALLALCVLLAWREYSLMRPDGLRVTFLDVGQGDSILLVSPTGKQVLIDGGPDLSALQGLGHNLPFFDRTIDLLILSHPDLDHIAAFPEIVKRYRIGAVLMTGIETDSPHYGRFLDALTAKKVPVLLADPAKDIDLGDGVRLDVLWPQPGLLGKRVSKANDTSIALRATYGSSSILFTGDMEDKEEREILSAGVNVDADILKVAHHGSRTSTSTGFLLAVSPNQAIISVSADNDYGHPHPWVMNRLKHFGIPARTTAEEGEITLLFPR